MEKSEKKREKKTVGKSPTKGGKRQLRNATIELQADKKKLEKEKRKTAYSPISFARKMQKRTISAEPISTAFSLRQTNRFFQQRMKPNAKLVTEGTVDPAFPQTDAVDDVDHTPEQWEPPFFPEGSKPTQVPEKDAPEKPKEGKTKPILQSASRVHLAEEGSSLAEDQSSRLKEIDKTPALEERLTSKSGSNTKKFGVAKKARRKTGKQHLTQTHTTQRLQKKTFASCTAEMAHFIQNGQIYEIPAEKRTFSTSKDVPTFGEVRSQRKRIYQPQEQTEQARQIAQAVQIMQSAEPESGMNDSTENSGTTESIGSNAPPPVIRQASKKDHATKRTYQPQAQPEKVAKAQEKEQAQARIYRKANKIEKERKRKWKAQQRMSHLENRRSLAPPMVQISVKRVPNPNGRFRYRTSVQLQKAQTPSLKQKAGLLHRVDSMRHTLVVGDKPSLQKTLKAWKPNNKKLYGLKWAARASYFATRKSGKAVWKTALATETFAIQGSKTVLRQTKRKLQAKYTQEAQDDAHKAMFAAGGFVISGSKGLYHHLSQKRSLRLEKARYKLIKSDAKIQKIESKIKLKPEKEAYKVQKKAWKTERKGFRNLREIRSFHLLDRSRQTPLRKASFLSKKQIFRSQKRRYRAQRKAIRFSNKSAQKMRRIQRKIKRETKPTFLPIKIGAAGIKAAGRKGWSKAVEADANNDAMQAIDAVKRKAGKAKSRRKSSLQRKQKKKAKLEQKIQKKGSKLQQKPSKLTKGQAKKRAAWKKRQRFARNPVQYTKNAAKKATKKAAKVVVNQLKKFAAAAIKTILPYIGIFLILLVFILLFFTMCTGMISSVFQSGGWVMGTYNAQDKYLSEAETYYTKLAYETNQSLLKVGDEDDWKKGLKELGVDVSDMKDDVDTWVWGKSNVLDEDTADYDFDCEKLWSFLCAYFYEYTDEGEMVYWKYGEDTEAVLEELFETEYQFTYYYDNQSHWEEMSTYTNDGLLHFVTTTSTPTIDGVEYGSVTFSSIPSSIRAFGNDNRIYFNLDNGEILDYNEDFAATGWYLLDQRESVTDPNGNVINGGYDQYRSYYSTDYSNNWGILYTVDQIDLWVYRHKYSRDLANGNDFMDTFQAIVTPQDYAVKWYINHVNDYVDGAEATEFSNAIFGYQQAGRNLLETNWLDQIRVTSNWQGVAYDSWYDRILAFEETYTDFGYYNDDGEWKPYGYAQVYQKYTWSTEVTLYYNMQQCMTFDEAIEQILTALDDGEARYEMYQAFLGIAEGATTSRGNHQTLTSPLANSIDEYLDGNAILNGFGYDMQAWNETHCSLTEVHEAIDIACTSGTPVYAGFSGTVDSVKDDSVVLRKDDYSYWYDGDGEGKNRDTKIYYSNLTPVVSKGDTVNEGDLIGYVNDTQYCDDVDNTSIGCAYLHVAVEIDTDGVGWDFVDPRLLFY